MSTPDLRPSADAVLSSLQSTLKHAQVPASAINAMTTAQGKLNALAKRAAQPGTRDHLQGLANALGKLAGDIERYPQLTFSGSTNSLPASVRGDLNYYNLQLRFLQIALSNNP